MYVNDYNNILRRCFTYIILTHNTLNLFNHNIFIFVYLI